MEKDPLSNTIDLIKAFSFEGDDTVTNDPQPSPKMVEQVGNYRVVSVLGEGNQGKVVLATLTLISTLGFIAYQVLQTLLNK